MNGSQNKSRAKKKINEASASQNYTLSYVNVYLLFKLLKYIQQSHEINQTLTLSPANLNEIYYILIF